ncbi:Nose resistant to fluoxetine protein 6 [Acropora cervicornis]|uniref:Nose resistant to fluoxetine protein 6 n=1 Tax=Acropora cervicornis TaxID=6130 RepID=A0AAD9VCP4_ACRCE|nr:Nose resistant to fluoxetine protein 6 [Acropora cervicornis]
MADDMEEIHHASFERNHLSKPDETQNNGPVIRFFLCFSLIRNTNRILDTARSSTRCHHIYQWHEGVEYVVGNAFILSSLQARFSFEIIANATLSVDTGLLVSYLSIRHMKKTGGKLSLSKFYFLRFWRLTPTYAFVLLFYMQITGFLGEGPIWFLFQRNRACEKYWWTNLLYINNFYPTKFSNACMEWSWYLANDMQFYIISPLILFAAYRETSENEEESILYEKPYTRVASYLVGMVLGYVLQSEKSWKTSKGITYIFNVIGWCLTTAISLSTVYGPYKTGRKHFTSAENIMYGTLECFGWSLALAWVIFACHRGLGGLVNSILSAPFWIPLSRLTYCAYLIHLILLSVRTGSLESLANTYSDIHVAFTFAGVVTLTYGIAFILCVRVEYPMLELGNLIFGKQLR